MQQKLLFAILLGLFTSITISSINVVYAELSFDEKVEVAYTLELVEGSVFLAMENNNSGNHDLTKMHLAHPIEKRYDLLIQYFDDHDEYLKKLQLVLFILKNTNPQMDKESFDASMSQILDVLQTGRILIIGDVVDDPVFKMKVIEKLLEKSKHEYAEGMESADDFRVLEIQDGYGFTIRADSLLSTVKLDTHGVLD